MDGRPFVGPGAIEAGARFERDFERAGMQPHITASLMPRLETRGRGARSHSGFPSDNALDARKRVRDALIAIGPELADIALDFCCFRKGLERMERERQWPVRSAKLMVRAALQALERHYAPPPTRQNTRHWGLPATGPTSRPCFQKTEKFRNRLCHPKHRVKKWKPVFRPARKKKESRASGDAD